MALKELFSTFNQGDIALIKSILDAEGIQYFLEGENFNAVRPLAIAPRFMVPEEDYEKAQEALSDIDISYGLKVDDED